MSGTQIAYGVPPYVTSDTEPVYAPTQPIRVCGTNLAYAPTQGKERPSCRSRGTICDVRRGETIVSFPRNLRLDEKTALKGKAGHIFQRLKSDNCYPDLM
eukprot:3940854-Rhodomonas_salina.1